jgi:SAM-dependent MidA family methyltransferase
MSSPPFDLPPPAADALAVSTALTRLIEDEVAAAGGWLSFERFMSLCLYQPGLGYYSGGSAKLGEAGDFVTAPEISPLFGKTLAGLLADWLAPLEQPVIVELGAGSGALAATLLEALSGLNRVLPQYLVLEPSAELRARQQARLANWGDRVRWLDALPQADFQGVVLANEVLDALPVARFVKLDQEVRPLGVRAHRGGFSWAAGARDADLARLVQQIEADNQVRLPEGYRGELCRQLPGWLAAVAAPLTRGALLFIDYGGSQRDLYRRERSDGTLLCHYRHRAHGDPFVWPGLQDLTAWVDFSRLAAAAGDCQLQVAGYTTQAELLLHSGIGDFLSGAGDAAALREAAALRTLLLPGEMGERFKAMLLCRDLDIELPGRDFRSRL